jgi:uncharacterized protein YjbJ (UPF0337 family)
LGEPHGRRPDVAEGNYQELIGRIKERTGETQQEIEQKLAS